MDNLLNMVHRSCASELAGATEDECQAAAGRSIRLPLSGGARIGPALRRSLARRRSERGESLVGGTRLLQSARRRWLSEVCDVSRTGASSTSPAEIWRPGCRPWRALDLSPHRRYPARR